MLGLTVLYVAFAMANPMVVPRLTIVPRPGDHRVWFDECAGRPGNRHDQHWERGSIFWSRVEASTLGGCIQ